MARRDRAPASELARRIERARRLPEASRRLAEMLPEQSPLYAGRGSSEAERLRGYIFASFEQVGLAGEAVPYVLEELETGRNPYTVAAAGRALRGASSIPTGAPELLVAAIARLRGSDDVVSFEQYAPAPAGGNARTSLADLASTLLELGPRAISALPALQSLLRNEGATFSTAVRAKLTAAVEALADAETRTLDCCSCDQAASARARVDERALPSAPELAQLALENQDGRRLSFSDAFSGRPTALAFFYTRCQNPEKCSLTVTRLGRLARRLRATRFDANVAGISYDPAFDRPARLKTYGADRGMAFSSSCSLLRTVGPLDPLVDAFALGVGFGPVTVNRHRLDLLVLDPSLRVGRRFERRLWHEDAVLNALRAAGE